MRISDWSSDVCSSDLNTGFQSPFHRASGPLDRGLFHARTVEAPRAFFLRAPPSRCASAHIHCCARRIAGAYPERERPAQPPSCPRSEEHTSELQSLMRISYAVFCLKKKNINNRNQKLERIETPNDPITNKTHRTDHYQLNT